jgi:hypothetical protein
MKKIFTLSILLLTMFGLNLSAESISCAYSFWTTPTNHFTGVTTISYDSNSQVYTVKFPKDSTTVDFKFKYATETGLSYYDYNDSIFSTSGQYAYAYLGDIGYLCVYGGFYSRFTGNDTAGTLTLEYMGADSPWPVVYGTDLTLQWPAPEATAKYKGSFTDGATAQTGVAATMEEFADGSRIIRNFLGAEGYDLKFNKDGKIYQPYQSDYIMDYKENYGGVSYYMGLTTSQQAGYAAKGTAIYPISATVDEEKHTYTLTYKTAELSWAWLYNLSETTYTYTYTWETPKSTTCDYSFWTSPTTQVKGTTTISFDPYDESYTVAFPEGEKNYDFKFYYDNTAGLSYYNYSGNLHSKNGYYDWAYLGGVGYLAIYAGNYCTFLGDNNSGSIALDYMVSYNNDYPVVYGTDISLQWPAQVATTTYNGAFTDGATSQTGVTATMEEFADGSRIIRNFLGAQGYDLKFNKDGKVYSAHEGDYIMNYALDYYGTTFYKGVTTSQQSGYSTTGTAIYPTSATVDETNHTYTLKYKTANLSWAYLYGLSDTEYTYTYVWGAAGVDNVNVDNSNAPVEYYNLNGVKVVDSNLTPGIYIKRQGSQASKVYVK